MRIAPDITHIAKFDIYYPYKEDYALSSINHRGTEEYLNDYFWLNQRQGFVPSNYAIGTKVITA